MLYVSKEALGGAFCVFFLGRLMQQLQQHHHVAMRASIVQLHGDKWHSLRKTI